MKACIIQLTDGNMSSEWWKDIIGHFVRTGDFLEIRCWKDEQDEIIRASRYGEFKNVGEEVVFTGTVTNALLNELLTYESEDKAIYNKMPGYFAVRLQGSHYKISSEHYGTELYVSVDDDKEIAFLKEVTDRYEDCFSIMVQN